MAKTKRNYVGFKGPLRERFLAAETPTEETHGHLYTCVMGPFRTKLGALCCVHYGDVGNPHTTTTSACDRIGKEYAVDLRGRPDRRVIG